MEKMSLSQQAIQILNQNPDNPDEAERQFRELLQLKNFVDDVSVEEVTFKSYYNF